MAKDRVAGEEKAGTGPRRERTAATRRQASPGASVASAWLALQRRLGNQTVQRLLAQRAASVELDDETAARINRARGSGQPLDGEVQAVVSEAMGHDLGGVRVHTSPEADALSRQLQARAFTTGHDLFFRAGAYDPHSSSGRQLLAHELTHVVQQSTGMVASGGRMTVNPPGDVYEQEADAVAQAVATGGATAAVQRQPLEEEEEPVQAQREQALQRQADQEEEEEPVQAQREQALQRQRDQEEPAG